ncbi:MAG: DinB family protein [Thermomicrobiales bacterium]
MSAFGDAFLFHLRTNLDAFLAIIADIPDDDLNTWKPAMTTEGDQETNTFAALGTHIVGAGEFMTLIAVDHAPVTRDREAEFHAKATQEELKARFNSWLVKLQRQLERLTEAELAAKNTHDRYLDRNWTNAQVMLHALDHTALHVGHAEIQKQLWLDERSRANAGDGEDRSSFPMNPMRITDKAAGRTTA